MDQQSPIFDKIRGNQENLKKFPSREHGLHVTLSFANPETSKIVLYLIPQFSTTVKNNLDNNLSSLQIACFQSATEVKCIVAQLLSHML